MIDSPVKSLLLSAAGVVFLITTLAPAEAQQTGTQTIVKVPDNVQPSALPSKPRMLNAPKKRQNRTVLPRPVPRAVSGGGIQVDQLLAINANEAGILVHDTGALGIDMWQGTPASLVTRLIPALPLNAPSSTMRKLMRRLLLSPARAPKGEHGGPSLISSRIRKLMMIGDLKGAADLLKVLPDVKREPALVRLETDLSFLTYDTSHACAIAVREMPLQPTPYWQKAFNFCEIINGREDKASLGLSLMRELGEADDIYFLLAEALIAKEPLVLSNLPNPTPLHLAMIREANVTFPADVLSSNTPFVSRAVATSSLASKGLRLEAAERADVAGALPKAALRQLYASVEFSEADRANPLSRAEVEFGPMVRALLYHTALTQTVPTAKAEATSRAFALARDEGRYASTVQVFEPVLRRIPPSADLRWFAPQAVRAFLVIGDQAQAQAWYQIIQTSAGQDADSQKALAQFRPVAWLFKFADQNISGPEIISAWSDANKNDPDVTGKAALLFNVLEALGFEIPPEAWTPYINATPRQGVSLPAPGLWRRILALANGNIDARDRREQDPAGGLVLSSVPAMPNALTTGEGAEKLGKQVSSQVIAAPLDEPGGPAVRVGETVLLSLIALGNAGPENIDPFVLREILRAMGRVGLKKEARALALDAVLARGL